MKKLNRVVLTTICTLTLSACGASNNSLCVEHGRLSKRMSELIVLGAANPTNFDKTEFEKVTRELSDVKGALEKNGSSGAACQ